MYEPINNFLPFFIQTLTKCMNEVTLNRNWVAVYGSKIYVASDRTDQKMGTQKDFLCWGTLYYLYRLFCL